MTAVKIVECPRDAMQGIENPIAQTDKIRYMQQLLQCGFDTLDCGSFVSPAAVPQMADTAEVLEQIIPEKNNTKLLVIIANERGAREAAAFDGIDYLGFPFSVNETFQLRNTNSTIDASFERLQHIQNIALASEKKVVAYLSMAFGNPYGEEYNRDTVLHWAEKIIGLGIDIVSLADTVGTANTADVGYLFSHLTAQWKHVEFGAHFHAKPGEWMPKIYAAYDSGCRRFDGAILGFGGCPFANDKLTGNIPTEELVHWLSTQGDIGLNTDALARSIAMAPEIFNTH